MKNFIETFYYNYIYRAICYIKGNCYFCDGLGKWYGLAPHLHNIKKTGSFIGSTEVKEDKDKWPDNFEETEPGGGIWSCEVCNGTGKRIKL
jgi:hypothetical protein